jgi:hypothetical protein
MRAAAKPSADAFVVPLEDRVQRGGGTYAGGGDDHLKDAAARHIKITKDRS